MSIWKDVADSGDGEITKERQWWTSIVNTEQQ